MTRFPVEFGADIATKLATTKNSGYYRYCLKNLEQSYFNFKARTYRNLSVIVEESVE